MTVRADVSNTSDVVIGRAGYRFDPGQTREGCEFSASQLPEVYQHPDLTVSVVSADSPGELPDDPEVWGIEIGIKANKAAQDLADEHGVNLFGVEGTGSGGQILKSDVEEAAIEAGSTGSAGRDFIPDEGSFEATTFDSPEDQAVANERARASLEDASRAAEEEHVAVAPSGTESEQPDQTNLEKDPIPRVPS